MQAQVLAVATVAGAQHGWWRGRRRAVHWFAGRGESWFAERGPVARAVLLGCGHWAAAARPIVPRVAGRAGVPYAVAWPVLAVSGGSLGDHARAGGSSGGALVVEPGGQESHVPATDRRESGFPAIRGQTSTSAMTSSDTSKLAQTFWTSSESSSASIRRNTFFAASASSSIDIDGRNVGSAES